MPEWRTWLMYLSQNVPQKDWVMHFDTFNGLMSHAFGVTFDPSFFNIPPGGQFTARLFLAAVLFAAISTTNPDSLSYYMQLSNFFCLMAR